MVIKTVLKVHITCQRCKTKLMQAVSGLEGIDKIEIDSGKDTLTVTGDADPVAVVKKTRKVCKFAEVISVGPPPKPDSSKPPPPDPKPVPPPPCMPPMCMVCTEMDAQITPITCSIS